EGDLPVLRRDRAVQRDALRLAEAHGEVGAGEVVVEEVALDDPTLVAEAEDEAVQPVAGEALHDVPEDGPVADGYHRLGQVFGHVTQPGALPPAKDDDLHGESRVRAMP